MKKLLLITFLVSAISFAQRKSEIDSKYFLLGTLSDYIGRNQFSEKKDVIESYAAHEKPLVDKLDDLFSNDSLIIEKIDSDNFRTTRYNLISKSINSSVNSLYNFKFSSLTYPKKDSIFNGKLKDSILKNDSEKVSFLLGCLSRFSVNYDMKLKRKEFCLQFANSISKFNLAQKTISELGFTISKVETLKNIQRINRVYFTVDVSNYKIFKEYSLIGIEIQNNLLNYFSRSKK